MVAEGVKTGRLIENAAIAMGMPIGRRRVDETTSTRYDIMRQRKEENGRCLMSRGGTEELMDHHGQPDRPARRAFGGDSTNMR